MSEINDKIIIWTKQGNIAQIETPEIGGAGSVVGSLQFNPGKFDNGSDDEGIDGRRFEYPRNNIVGFDPNAFIMEHWFKTDGWTCTNGVPSDSQFHRIFDWYVDNSNRFTVQVHPTSGFRIAIVIGGAVTTINFTTGVNWDAGLHHLIFVWDRLGIDGGPDTLRIYIDTVLKGNTTASTNIQNTANGNLHFHNVFFGGVSLGPWHGLFDNLKMYKNPTEQLITEIKANWQNEGNPSDFISGNNFNNGFNEGLNEAIN